MRTLPIVLAAASVFTLSVGASAAPATDPVRAIEDAAVSVLTGPESTEGPDEAPTPAESATATTTGSTIHQPPAPEPDPFFTPDDCYLAHADDIDALNDCWGIGPEHHEMPSVEQQIEDCVIQEGNRAWCEDKIRHGAVD